MLKKILIIIWILFPTILYAKNIKIITTIKPIESLISAIIDDSDSVSSLIENNQSPHNFILKPSHISKFHKSDAVIIINPRFETFIRTSLRTIPEKTPIIHLSDTPNLSLYPTEHYGLLHKGHHSTDYHIWLSPINAIKIIHYITAQLSLINPEKKSYLSA